MELHFLIGLKCQGFIHFSKPISWEGATTLYGAEVSKAYLSVDGGGFLFKVCIRVSGLDGGSERRNKQTLTFTVIECKSRFFKATPQPPASAINDMVDVPGNNKQ